MFEVLVDLYCYKQTRTNSQGFKRLKVNLIPSLTFIKSKETEISFVVPSFLFEFTTFFNLKI